MRSRDANSTQAVCTKNSSTPARPTSYETATGIDRWPSKAAQASIKWFASTSNTANARSASRFAEWFVSLPSLVTGSGMAPVPRPPSTIHCDDGRRSPLLHHHDDAEEDFDESARECAHAN